MAISSYVVERVLLLIPNVKPLLQYLVNSFLVVVELHLINHITWVKTVNWHSSETRVGIKIKVYLARSNDTAKGFVFEGGRWVHWSDWSLRLTPQQ